MQSLASGMSARVTVLLRVVHAGFRKGCMNSADYWFLSTILLLCREYSGVTRMYWKDLWIGRRFANEEGYMTWSTPSCTTRCAVSTEIKQLIKTNTASYVGDGWSRTLPKIRESGDRRPAGYRRLLAG